MVEAGVRQRVLALERFLADVYGPGEILADGVVPRRLVASSSHFHRCVAGVEPAGRRARPRGRHRPRARRRGQLPGARGQPAHAVGISYVIENRRAMTHVFPELFASHRIRRVADYPQQLLDALRATAPPGVDDPCVVRAHARASTTPRTSSTRSSPARWASSSSRVAISCAATSACYMRTTGGRAARRRRLPAHRRRVPRPAALPPGLGARLRGHRQRGARRAT